MVWVFLASKVWWYGFSLPPKCGGMGFPCLQSVVVRAQSVVVRDQSVVVRDQTVVVRVQSMVVRAQSVKGKNLYFLSPWLIYESRKHEKTALLIIP